jgi:hypothetical protein
MTQKDNQLINSGCQTELTILETHEKDSAVITSHGKKFNKALIKYKKYIIYYSLIVLVDSKGNSNQSSSITSSIHRIIE